MDVIVVGSGIAGLIAALELAKAHEVTLVTKSQLSEANTRYAQGGIAAVMHPDDRVEEHIEDTLRAGAGLCRPEAVQILCEEGPDRIRDLIRLGVAFDQHNGELAQGREAAHSRARVLHAGGDATGLAIETALVHAVRQNPAIHVLEHTYAADLCLTDGHVTGLHILTPNNIPQLLPADAVLLASGGAGHLYPYTTNPKVATGDGIALALRAGAQLADVEFYQFHPTALSAEGGFLISEAVRGDGAVLRDLHGHRFMQAIHPDAELAPRDVVARGIAATMARQNNQPVLLDATHLGADFLAQRFPTINAACQRAGLDWAHNPIPVAPAAHYWMGGVQTDTSGRTSIPGLFAVGEVACTGVHGANRLASNSLLESIVFAHRAAHLLLDDPRSALTPATLNDTQTFILPDSSGAPSSRPQEVKVGGPAIHSSPSQPAIQHQVPTEAATALPSRAALQDLMWSAAGIVRTEDDLRAALTQLRRWYVPLLDSIEARETANMLQLADAVVTAALARQESRGAHFRADFPAPREAERHHLTLKRA
ncbi:MAG TPA: L-aspartate oxidase [Acidobacteriaceae bacterium]|nr:L-aspartate oxidase [Acidobacteriaceae bacterium]